MRATFFGHSDAPESIKDNLKSVITELIEKQNVNVFYVGDKGNFDLIVKKILKSLSITYPQIKFYVVLSYLPVKNDRSVDYSDTIFPSELENVPRKFAIDRRNNWMIEHSDIVITYVIRNIGGAAKFKNIAERKNKRVINVI